MAETIYCVPRHVVLDVGDNLSHRHDMATEQLNWALVDRVAASLDASEVARRKWRQTGRQVPHEWRARIIDKLASEGVTVRFADFDALPETPGSIAA